MNINLEELTEWRDEARRELEREQERAREKYDQTGNFLRVLEYLEPLLSQINKLQKENEQLLQENERLQQKNDELQEKNDELQEENEEQAEQLQQEKNRTQSLEMQLSELRKLSDSMARKSPNADMLKVIQTFVNKSKQKRIEKRTAVKELVLEMVVSNGIVLPEELAATIESLDDEQPEAKVVHVAGNYNDIHDNEQVDLKEKKDDGKQ